MIVKINELGKERVQILFIEVRAQPMPTSSS